MALVLPRTRRRATVGRFEVFEVDAHEMETPAGASYTTHTLRCRDWVAVAAVTSDGRFVLVRQHRYGVGAVTIETPGGIVDEGEDPVAAGLRELREETGWSADRLESLGFVHPNPALQDNRCFLYLARDVRETGEVHNDERESTEAVVLDRAELERALRDGDITHSLAVVALERALRVLG